MQAIAMRRRTRLAAGFAPQTAAAVRKPGELDIARIDFFQGRGGFATGTVIKLTTRSGLTGYGECQAGAVVDSAAVRKNWIGKAATTYALIDWNDPAAAALDMAMLDIVGKSANAPVYRLLGGPTRNKVRVLGNGTQPGEGVKAVTVKIPAVASRNQGKAFQNQLRAAVEAVPAALDFVVAADGALTPGDAASCAATLETKHPLWFDEPCSVGNVEAIRKISGENVTPLGFGKGIRDAAVFQALLRDGLIDVVRPEIGLHGITGSRRIGAMAETYYVALAPRISGGAIMLAAAIQLAASLPNFFIQQMPEGQTNFAQPVNGFIELTTKPGLGITVDEKTLEAIHAA